MRTVLELLPKEETWDSFLSGKITSGLEPQPEIDRLQKLCSNPSCRAIARDISSGTYTLSIPKASEISKNRFGKKRTVFLFTDEERMVLKVLAGLLYRFDHLFSDNLYSYRRNIGVKKAISRLSGISGIERMYGYKADIHDYFNSIPTEMITEDLDRNLGDARLAGFFRDMLSDPRCFKGPEITEMRKGVMAGVPTSPFLANFFLRELDDLFGGDIVYMRYADDIIMFAGSREELAAAEAKLRDFLEKKHLELNPDKESRFGPGDTVEFLGFSVRGKEVDISANTLYKMKGKIRRKARAYRRWMLEKNRNGKKIVPEQAVWAMIRDYNLKFFGKVDGEVSWDRWFFPSITTDKSLHEIDLYLQQELRYIATGRHNKKNFERMPYSELKRLKYRSLVHEYHEWINSPPEHRRYGTGTEFIRHNNMVNENGL